MTETARVHPSGEAREMDFGEDTLHNALRRIHNLKGLSEPQIARIARLRPRHWGPEQFIINEGDRDQDRMIILLAGKVFVRKRVIKEGVETYEQVAELSGPTVIGEDSFFTGLRRSASVWARDRVAGIQIEREDFNGLLSLDRTRGVNFLKKLVEEGVQRAERTLVLYINTLQLVMSKASLTRCVFFENLEAFRRRIPKNGADLDGWKTRVREIMLIIRELNAALEELYRFANLPELRLSSVDIYSFRLPKIHRFYPVFKTLTEELAQTQMLVPIDTMNLKDMIMNAVMDGRDHSLSTVDYSDLVSIAAEVYREFAANYRLMGFSARQAAPMAREERDPLEDSLLWDEVG